MGNLTLDTLAYTVIDPVFQRFYNSSMQQIWGTPAVNLITIESLLMMTAALNDYDDNFMEAYVYPPSSNDCSFCKVMAARDSLSGSSKHCTGTAATTFSVGRCSSSS